jgi:hypothetical protein
MQRLFVLFSVGLLLLLLAVVDAQKPGGGGGDDASTITFSRGLPQSYVECPKLALPKQPVSCDASERAALGGFVGVVTFFLILIAVL